MSDLSSKEPHRQVNVTKVMTSGRLCGVMVSTLAQNARDVGYIPTLGAILPNFITPMTHLSLWNPTFQTIINVQVYIILVTAPM